MSTFQHADLIPDINASLAPFRKTQGNAMAGFGQLARAAITDGALSGRHKELVALAIAVTQRCSGCIGFHVKALLQLGCTRRARGDAHRLRLHGWRAGADVRRRGDGGVGEDVGRRRGLSARCRPFSLSARSAHDAQVADAPRVACAFAGARRAGAAPAR